MGDTHGRAWILSPFDRLEQKSEGAAEDVEYIFVDLDSRRTHFGQCDEPNHLQNGR